MVKETREDAHAEILKSERWTVPQLTNMQRRSRRMCLHRQRQRRRGVRLQSAVKRCELDDGWSTECIKGARADGINVSWPQLRVRVAHKTLQQRRTELRVS